MFLCKIEMFTSTNGGEVTLWYARFWQKIVNIGLAHMHLMLLARSLHPYPIWNFYLYWRDGLRLQTIVDRTVNVDVINYWLENCHTILFVCFLNVFFLLCQNNCAMRNWLCYNFMQPRPCIKDYTTKKGPPHCIPAHLSNQCSTCR